MLSNRAIIHGLKAFWSISLVTIAAAFLVLWARPSPAQQVTGSPEVLALQGKLMQELSNGLECNTRFIALQQKEAKTSTELAEAQKKILELEARLKP